MNPRFLIFKASAGSGKTYSLAVQYICLLVACPEAQAYRNTLAVTFTNKATAEMKERILEQLYGIAHGLDSSKSYVESIIEELQESYKLCISKQELQARCQKCLNQILHDYSHFSISTIDAFFQRVFRNMAHELGLGARLRVDLNNGDIVRLAVDRLIDDITSDDKELLPWFRQFIMSQLEDGKTWDIRQQLSTLGMCLFEESYLTRNEMTNKQLSIANVREYQQKLQKLRAILLSELCNKSKEFESFLSEGTCDTEWYKRFNLIDGYIKLLQGKENITKGASDTIRSYAADPMNVLNSKSKKDPYAIEQTYEFCQRLNELITLHDNHITTLNSIAIILKEISPLGLFGAISKCINNINEENGRFTLSRTPLLLSEMSENDSPFVFEKIGNRYSNVMIDEFQDTSLLQWQNFKNLLINSLSEGGMGMVVGDVKQSIYRFRGGDWSLLKNLEKDVCRNAIIFNKPLDTNRRSLWGIVEFNNRFFKRATAVLDDKFPRINFRLSDIYADVHQDIPKNHATGGKVCITICNSQDKDKRDDFAQNHQYELMCNTIEKLHSEQGVEYSEMAILLRKNNCEDMVNYISDHLPHVQLVSDEAFMLSSSSALSMLMDALHYINNEEKSKVSIRLLMDSYSKYILKDNVLSTCFCKPEDILPEEFICHTTDLRRLPLYELCESLYRILSLEQIKGEESYVLTFFDELLNYLRENPADISSFLKYWDDKLHSVAVPSGKIDGIRILTAHKSKGLQYRVVLMPDANWDLCDDRGGKNHIWATPGDDGLNDLGSVRVSMTSTMQDSTFSQEYQEEHERQRADETNLLYVAFTRAEEYLYVWGLGSKISKKDQEAGNVHPVKTVADLMYETLLQTVTGGIEGVEQAEDEETGMITYTFEGPKKEEKKTEQQKRNDEEENRMAPTYKSENISMCSLPGNVEFLQSNQTRQFIRDIVDSEQTRRESFYIQQGILFHNIMSRISQASDLDNVLNECEEQGLFPSERLQNNIRKLFEQGLKRPVISDWFSGDYKLFNECSVLAKDEKGRIITRRPDRVMIKDKEIIVVDYKFGRSKQEHHDQVHAYMNILRDMMPDYNTQGYLWYVYSNEIVPV